jgi:hypothetical protein
MPVRCELRDVLWLFVDSISFLNILAYLCSRLLRSWSLDGS